MPKFFVTYPQRIPQLRNAYSVVEAENSGEAAEKVSEIRGPVWAFIYSEEDFKPQPEKYNLHEVPLSTEYCYAPS